MKRLEQYSGKLASAIYKYLIETESCFEEAIEEVMQEGAYSGAIRQVGLQDKPEDYPYVLMVCPDDRNDRLNLAFVIPGDFDGEVSEVGSLASELRKLYNDETMAPWLLRITDKIAQGDRECIFRDLDDELNPDNQYAVNDHQIAFIRSKGYKVEWDKYPEREYTVSGWRKTN